MSRLDYAKTLNEVSVNNKEEIDFLIFDDFDMNCLILERILSKIRKNIKVKSSTTIEGLYKILSVNTPKVVFIDLMIGTSFDGIKLIEDLREITKNIILKNLFPLYC